jgi:hypothetical protein
VATMRSGLVRNQPCQTALLEGRLGLIERRTREAVGAETNLLFFSRCERACSSSFVFF